MVSRSDRSRAPGYPARMTTVVAAQRRPQVEVVGLAALDVASSDTNSRSVWAP